MSEREPFITLKIICPSSHESAMRGCGCCLMRTETEVKMYLCPMHAAAGEMLEALKGILGAFLLVAMDRENGEIWGMLNVAKNTVQSATRKAETKEKT